MQTNVGLNGWSHQFWVCLQTARGPSVLIAEQLTSAMLGKNAYNQVALCLLAPQVKTD